MESVIFREVAKGHEETYSFLMFTKGCMDHSNIEENFRGIGVFFEDLQGIFILLLVIVIQGFYPAFDFLLGI